MPTFITRALSSYMKPGCLFLKFSRVHKSAIDIRGISKEYKTDL